MRKRTFAWAMEFAAIVLLGALASSCAGVKPYERSRLAKPKMQLGRDPEATALEQHVYEYREGSSGGYGTIGGGCGCN